jgi:hypothetical protein
MEAYETKTVFQSKRKKSLYLNPYYKITVTKASTANSIFWVS